MIQLPRAPMRRGPEDSEDGASLQCGESGRHWAQSGEPGGGFALFHSPSTTACPARAILRPMPETRQLRDVLSTMADDLIERLDAAACAISRVIGDVLIL